MEPVDKRDQLSKRLTNVDREEGEASSDDERLNQTYNYSSSTLDEIRYRKRLQERVYARHEQEKGDARLTLEIDRRKHVSNEKSSGSDVDQTEKVDNGKDQHNVDRKYNLSKSTDKKYRGKHVNDFVVYISLF